MGGGFGRVFGRGLVGCSVGGAEGWMGRVVCRCVVCHGGLCGAWRYSWGVIYITYTDGIQGSEGPQEPCSIAVQVQQFGKKKHGNSEPKRASTRI